jgi:hypothetical protein
MDEEIKICKLCEEIKKDNKFPRSFTDLLNAGAFVLISIIIILFFVLAFPSNENDYKKVTNVRINLTSSNNTKQDSINLSKALDLKIKEFEEKIKDSEKERNENLKYYATLIGFIFSIVGFFGFKSIHDTRQMALDAVKVKAEEVAKKAITEKISDLTKEHVEDFLNKDGKKDIEEIAEKIASEKGVEVAKKEMSLIKIDNDDYRKGLQEDIETTQRFQNNNFNFLLKRIQELELKLYGKPGDDELPDFDNNPKINPDNEQPVL